MNPVRRARLIRGIDDDLTAMCSPMGDIYRKLNKLFPEAWPVKGLEVDLLPAWAQELVSYLQAIPQAVRLMEKVLEEF